MSANLMYSPLESVFESTMQREGKILTTYSSGTEFRAFFRIRNDNENQKETIVIYYDVTAPVHSGTLVTIGNEVFLALNKETVENDVYYKSTLIKCNGVYNDNDGMICNIPFYTDNMKSSVSVGNSVISMLDGNIEVLTEENSLSKRIKINATFNEFGRTFKIANKYTIDGITHFISEVQADQKPNFVYSVHMSGVPDTYVMPNTELQLEAIPYMGISVTTGATLDWTSSDDSIAAVDATGKVTCLSEGSVKITVLWIEKDVSESVFITISNTDTPVIPTYNYSITGNTNLRNSYKRTYTFVSTDKDGNAVDWSNADFKWNVVADFDVSQTVNGNKITLLVDNEDLVDLEATFLLQAIVDGEIKAEIEIMVVE